MSQSGLNRATLLGTIGRDAELRHTANSAVCGFSLATNESYRDSNGAIKERTDWHNIVLWGKRAEALAPYLKKGKRIYVEGRIETHSWEKDGVKHYRTEVNASNVVLLSPSNSQPSYSEDDGDDIPL